MRGSSCWHQLLLMACGQTKAEAQQAAKTVADACKEDTAKGVSLGQDWYVKNKAFRQAVDATAVTWDVEDPKKFNYCGAMFSQAQLHIDNS